MPNPKEIYTNYELMKVYFIKKSGYSIEYVNKMDFKLFNSLILQFKSMDK